MSLDRRNFVKMTGLAALGTELPVRSATASPEKASDGPRLAIVIDLAECGKHPRCNLCTTACRKEHNIPEIPDPRHEINWIWKEPFRHAFPDDQNPYLQTERENNGVLLLCNHCDNPPCVRVCPTGATWKRKDGVVMMDWHRCIGCRYCMAACPYGSRSFNWIDPRPFIDQQNPDFPTRTQGVVEKCTLCDERLAEGKIPACVESCPHGAMHFGDLSDPESKVRKLLEERFAIRRKPGLGTHPQIYYLV